MPTQKVSELNVGDRIRFNDEDYSVSGIDWPVVYVCSEQATDWRLPLHAWDRVEVVSYAKEDE